MQRSEIFSYFFVNSQLFNLLHRVEISLLNSSCGDRSSTLHEASLWQAAIKRIWFFEYLVSVSIVNFRSLLFLLSFVSLFSVLNSLETFWLQLEKSFVQGSSQTLKVFKGIRSSAFARIIFRMIVSIFSPKVIQGWFFDFHNAHIFRSKNRRICHIYALSAYIFVLWLN